jgi:hypothetical protein
LEKLSDIKYKFEHYVQVFKLLCMVPDFGGTLSLRVVVVDVVNILFDIRCGASVAM